MTNCYDYYLSFSVKNGCLPRWGKWNDRVNNLFMGDVTQVSSNSERKGILRAANRMGMRVKSTKSGDSYTIQRVSIGSPRRRGHPKRQPII